jgi:hypothetical protein
MGVNLISFSQVKVQVLKLQILLQIFVNRLRFKPGLIYRFLIRQLCSFSFSVSTHAEFDSFLLLGFLL